MVATKTTLGAPILLGGEDDTFFSESSRSDAPFTSRDLASETILRLLLLAGIVVIDILVPHAFKRQVVGGNWVNYAYPYNPVETISFPTLLLVGLIVPTVIVALLTLATQRAGRRRIVLLNFVLAITLSVCLSECLTSLFKKSFGQLRPDFLSRCFGTADVVKYLDSVQMTFDDIPPFPTCVAQAGPRLMEEARLSFPSGHSAYAAAAFGVLAMWLHKFIPTQFVIMMPSLRLVAGVGAATVPFYVAVSRTADYRHHPSDVIAGLLLGFIVAFFSFRVYHRPSRPNHPSLLDFVKPSWHQEPETTSPFVVNTPPTRGPLDV